MTAIIVALISAGTTLLVCLINNNAQSKKLVADIKTEIAVTNTIIEELTREVREHNNFAKRMPVVENEIKHIEDDIHKLQKYHQ